MLRTAMNNLLLLIMVIANQIIMNSALTTSNAALHPMEAHNKSKNLSYLSDVQLQRSRRQSSLPVRQLISIPGYATSNTDPTQPSSTVFCPIYPSMYPLKFVVISNIGSTSEATLSIPNQPQSNMRTRKTPGSLLVFNDPPKSQCYALDFSSPTSDINTINVNNVKIQFIYDSSIAETDEKMSNGLGSSYLPPMRNHNMSCGFVTCQNGGVCLSVGATSRCRCDSSNQWLGTSCSIPNPCVQTPCKNHGQCYYRPDATYYCVCYSGYSGNNCQLLATTTAATPRHNPCSSNHPCLNGGTCLHNGARGEFTCICSQHYTGPQCQSLNSLTMTTTLTTTTTTTTSQSNTCGICELKSSIDAGNRVVNNQPVNTHVWPWIVSLEKGGVHLCAGTLIDASHVITAAHCFDTSNRSPNMYKIVAGLLDLHHTHLSSVQHLTVDHIFQHEQYSSAKLINDIAVIKLRTHAKINTLVHPICLPTNNSTQDPHVGQLVQIAGWGHTNSGARQILPQLQEAYIEILNSSGTECNVWAQQGHAVNNTRQICAMRRDSRPVSCQGDSGGPLIRNIDRKWFLFGIISYGDGICTSTKAAGVYTRVSMYVPWIQQKLRL